MPAYLVEIDNKHHLYIKLTPNAKADKIGGIFIDEHNQEYLKVSTTVIPEDNKANKQLIKLIAKEYKLAKSSLKLIKGHKARLKVLEIEGYKNEIKNSLR